MSEPNKILISCREATGLEQMRKEGKITFRTRVALWIHLLYCKFCRLFVKQSALLEEQVREITASNKSYTLSDERKEAMKKVLGQ